MTDSGKHSRSVISELVEDVASNPSANQTMGDVIADRLSRRDLGKGLLAVAAIGATVSPLALLSAAPGAHAQRAGANAGTAATTPSFGFKELAAGSDSKTHVADGYHADVLLRWGDKVMADAPAFDPARQSAASQSKQFGYNNDFLGYIPINGSSDHGLLVVNHEYTNEELMFAGLGGPQQGSAKFAKITKEHVDIEMMAHGGAVVEIKKTAGTWAVMADSKFSRRITAMTPIAISGPAAGHAMLKTKADPTGTKVLGMVNNCAGGITPWGTWLTCEENFNGYFFNKKAAAADPQAKVFKRYGAPAEQYAWGKFHDRFDVAKEPNEWNRFGWVVEIDPMDPYSVPVKRTALGRFKHEGAGNVINKDGRFVIYQGDDQRFDYVYKFVTEGKVDTANRSANKDLLDSGTLYVAKYNADGTGQWMGLTHGQGKLTAANGFPDQATVLVNARLAADLLGATKMDRPEDIDVNPKTGKVYLMLTNNNNRKADQLDAANPRAENKFGHIIEMEPAGGDHAATTFNWEILVKCGDPALGPVGATFNPATSKDGWFGMPDNGFIDTDGRLWVATDGNSAKRTGRADGVWAMETEGKARGTSKLFFRVCDGAEMCGPMMTPDMTTLFVAIQHPGEAKGSTFEKPLTRWPDFKGGMPPRPSVVAITKKDGGKIGS